MTHLRINLKTISVNLGPGDIQYGCGEINFLHQIPVMPVKLLLHHLTIVSLSVHMCVGIKYYTIQYDMHRFQCIQKPSECRLSLTRHANKSSR